MPLDDRFEALFRASLFAFYAVETGCPALYELAPFGGREALTKRMARILGMNAESEEHVEHLASLYADYVLAVPDLVASFDLAPGRYDVIDVSGAIETMIRGGDDTTSKRRAELAFAAAIDDSFRDYRREVHITSTHLAMVRRARWQVEASLSPIRGQIGVVRDRVRRVVLDTDRERARPEFAESLFPYPVATGDGKRPYGDRTYYYWDLEDVGVPGVVADAPSDVVGARAKFSPEAEARVDAWQGETVLALQALAQYGRRAV